MKLMGGSTRNRAAKVNDTTGALDATWNPNCNSAVYHMFKDGSFFYLCGSFTSVSGITRNRAAKVTMNR